MAEEKKGAIYHERQSLQRCAVHAVNNLLQRQVYTKAGFDVICTELNNDSVINPHKSILGTGNYDVNVLTVAIERQGYSVHWFDKRKGLPAVRFQLVLGLILNAPSRSFFGLIGGQHWFAVRQLQGNWYNLDSKLAAPQRIHNLATFLTATLADERSQMLLILPAGMTAADAYVSFSPPPSAASPGSGPASALPAPGKRRMGASRSHSSSSSSSTGSSSSEKDYDDSEVENVAASLASTSLSGGRGGHAGRERRGSMGGDGWRLL